ncbi:MAG: hypothetical protein AAF337_14940 [Pseudomonadota bacterium]
MGQPTAFDGMMREICVEMGFCGSVVDEQPRHVTDFIPKTGQVSADQFVLWVLKAEGMSNLGVYNEHYESLKAVFLKHMKGDTVDAQTLAFGK